MTTSHLDQRKQPLIVCKGAPEAILCKDVVQATEHDLRLLRERAAELAAAGLRTLAIAAGAPGNVRPLGVVGIGDPVRTNARSVLTNLTAAGIRTVIVSGDHPTTARHVAEQVGIWESADIVVDCSEGDWQRTDTAHVRVFARARPEQKLAIVDALMKAGDVVAVTGDGVNDAPALRRSDIGIAMGGGTEVAHQAAQLVLANDDLATLSVAVSEGRRVYDNIRRFLRYALSGGVAELITMLAGPFLGLAIPILPAQILWINLLTHGLPGVAMGAEPGSSDAMHRPPRRRAEPVLGSGLGRSALLTGALIGACTLTVGTVASAMSLPWQSLAFLTLGFCQLGVALAVRAPRRTGVRNPWLGAAVALSAVLLVAGVFAAPLRALLGTQAVTAWQLLIIASVSAIPALATVVASHRSRRSRHSAG